MVAVVAFTGGQSEPEIDSLLPNGYNTLVRVRTENRSLTSQVDLRRHRFSVGERIHARFTPGALHLFDPQGNRIIHTSV